MSGHTPGPWEADGASDSGVHYHQIISPALDRAGWPYTIADTLNNHHEISEEEDKANALLLAAAHDLAEALELALGSLDDDDPCALAALAALRKAGRLP